ncbi:MAG TPA: tRNA lysidine(34) synthetase TilS [Nitrospirales bacterium]|nr:tRNA lysidine(34) synthetase TilS [Nitrospirales bacterium]
MAPRHDTAPHPVFQQVVSAIRRKKLLRHDDRVLVAVSGGSDSVCLVMVLHEMRQRGVLPGLDLHVAHVNYGLRGEESEKDETYVRDLGKTLSLPVHVERVHLVPRPGQTLQSQARDTRYAFFARVRREYGLTAVATGHTADDQAETVLLWLLRGSGTSGLAGIPAQRDDGIIRPLLGVTQEQVLDYLASRGIAYRTDASNATRVYRRNRIRHEIVPLLRTFNPQIVQGLARAAEIFAAEAALLDDLERERWKAVVKDVAPGCVVLQGERLVLEPLGLQRRLIRRALSVVRGSAAGLTFRHVEDVLARVVGAVHCGKLDLPSGIVVERDGALITVGRSCVKGQARAGADWAPGVPLSIPGKVLLGKEGPHLLALKGCDPVKGRADGHSMLVMDAGRLGDPLTVRNWRPGDWFCPSGMKGHRKKLQDFFVDQKIPRNQRAEVPLVVAPEGIVWVVGYRGDERFMAGKATTRFVTLKLVKE